MGVQTMRSQGGGGGIDSHDARMVEDGDNGHENGDISNVAKSHDSFDSISAGTKDGNIVEEVDESSSVSSSLKSQNSRHVSVVNGWSTRKFSSKKRSEKKKDAQISGSSCEMKLLNSIAQLVEPLESRKFARFSLQYTAVEEKRLKMSDAMLSAYDRELYQCKLLRQWRRGPLILLDVESLDRNCGTSCTVYGMHYDGIVYEAAVTWNTLIDSHCKSGHHNKAEELFEAMQNSGCSPFTTTYNIMINSFGEQEKWEDVKTLLGKMQISWDGCHSRTWGLHSHA